MTASENARHDKLRTLIDKFAKRDPEGWQRVLQQEESLMRAFPRSGSASLSFSTEGDDSMSASDKEAQNARRDKLRKLIDKLVERDGSKKKTYEALWQAAEKGDAASVDAALRELGTQLPVGAGGSTGKQNPHDLRRHVLEALENHLKDTDEKFMDEFFNNPELSEELSGPPGIVEMAIKELVKLPDTNVRNLGERLRVGVYALRHARHHRIDMSLGTGLAATNPPLERSRAKRIADEICKNTGIGFKS